MRKKDDVQEPNFTTTIHTYQCLGPTLCQTCSWSIHNDGDCCGCDDDYQQRCLKRICGLGCYTCSGGKHARVFGCCGRAPASWREYWDRLLEYSMPDYAPEPLQIDCLFIPIIYAQIRKHRIPEQFPQIDAWAVPIHKVANRKGKFHSDDLKDYLGLPPDRKLILSTSAPDDYQEMLWEKGPRMDYKRHGIDYWFPAHFSIYDDDSKLYQFTSAKRQQLHAIWTKSQFVWFGLGEHIHIEFIAPIRNASSILIYTGRINNKRRRTILKEEVRVADNWFPAETAFFIVGGRRHLSISSQRLCYEINSNWLMRGLMGHNLARVKDMGVPKEQVLINNLKEVLENVHSSISI